MRIETSLKKRDSAVSSLRDVYARARISRPTHAAMQSEIADARATLSGAPEWTRAFFDGYARALSDSLYMDDSLVFGGYLDGQFYSTQSKRPDYYGHFMQANVWSDETRPNGRVSGLGHYWTPSLSDGRVTPAPYSL